MLQPAEITNVPTIPQPEQHQTSNAVQRTHAQILNWRSGPLIEQ